MVIAIRHIEKALGIGHKCPTASEKENRLIVRKSIVAIADIKKGEVMSDLNIAAKRPGNGISPMRWHDVIGKRASKDYREDDLIRL
jgi:N,N'-diacetyllegionaminate synthase